MPACRRVSSAWCRSSKEVSERLITNPHVQAVSFVGTSAVAESVYRMAAAHGKRVRARTAERRTICSSYLMPT